MKRLSILVVFMVVLFGGHEARASGNISNFRLPFNGSWQITQGPRCPSPNSHNDGLSASNKEAIDFDLNERTAVVATESGVAYYSYDAPKDDDHYAGGNVIQILHKNGLKSIYAHLSEPNQGSGFVPKDVERGEIIGLSGSSGNVGEHLHFAVVRSNEPNSLAGTPVPIWQMPGITWDPKYDDLPYPASGECLSDGLSDGSAQWPPPGKRSLERSEFTVERTNPTLSEEVMFSTEIKNTGEVTVYINTK